MRDCAQCGREMTESVCGGCGRLETATTCERHPDREAPGVCVVCGSAVCRECDRHEAREYICPEHHGVPIVDGWAQVYSTSDDLEAQLIRDNLKAEGMDAEILSQKDHFAVPVDLGDLSAVRLLVPASSYADALSLLAGHMDSSGEVAFGCPECGEAYEPGSSVCASCGAALPEAARQRAAEPER